MTQHVSVHARPALICAQVLCNALVPSVLAVLLALQTGGRDSALGATAMRRAPHTLIPLRGEQLQRQSLIMILGLQLPHPSASASSFELAGSLLTRVFIDPSLH